MSVTSNKYARKLHIYILYACKLTAGPDGQLPEELQKLEPAILELVCNEVVESGGTVVWDDIAGQDQAKRLIQELVVWPMKNPDLFRVWHCCCTLSSNISSGDVRV